MQVGFMITNGGPHPADKWADMTTETILGLVQVAEDSVSPEALAARDAKRKLRPILFDIFNEHHDKVQKHEQGELSKSKKLTTDPVQAIDTKKHTPSTMEQVDAALADTPFAAHFAKPEVKAVLHAIVGQHTADVMHIERRWHQDRLNSAKGA